MKNRVAITEVYNYIIGELSKIKVNSPEAETRLILEHIYNQDFKELMLNNCLFNDEIKEKINLIINRRKKYEPIQYIIGKAPFYNYELFVNDSVLIPRPETEILVDFVIKKLKTNGKVLDIGCGSGTISVTVGYERKDCEVVTFDISPAAIEVAKSNAKFHNVQNIEFRESNLLSAIKDNEKFDIITANLPYVSEDEYLECDVEVREFEPKLALVANNNGLELIYKLAEKASSYLNPQGFIIFEIGDKQSTQLVEYLKSLNLYQDIKILKDYNNIERFVYAIL